MNHSLLYFKKATTLIALMVLMVTYSAIGQTYSMGHLSMNLVDSARNNRPVNMEVFYPADAAGYNVPVAGPTLKKF
ncbi:MAG TPA: hypothetical protein VFW78_00915, partial [Bacteroidia bacterium]|nr:hypothetical protein [Bacteroidia bacterium]